MTGFQDNNIQGRYAYLMPKAASAVRIAVVNASKPSVSSKGPFFKYKRATTPAVQTRSVVVVATIDSNSVRAQTATAWQGLLLVLELAKSL